MRAENLLKVLASLMFLSTFTFACGVEEESETDFGLLRKLRKARQDREAKTETIKFGLKSMGSKDDPTNIDSVLTDGLSSPGAGGLNPMMTPMSAGGPPTLHQALSTGGSTLPTPGVPTTNGTRGADPLDCKNDAITPCKGSDVDFTITFKDEKSLKINSSNIDPAFGRYKVTLEFIDKDGEVLSSAENCKDRDNSEVEITPGQSDISVKVCDKDAKRVDSIKIPISSD